MKKTKLLLLTAFVLLLSVSLFACGGEPSNGGASDNNTGSNYTYTLLDDDTYSIASYKGFEKSITLPETYNGKAVTSIGDEAFARKNQLEKIVIPDNYTQLGSGAFFGCTNLTSVDISKNIEASMGEFAFADCPQLKECRIQAALLPEFIFAGIEKLVIDFGVIPDTFVFQFQELKYLEILPDVTNLHQDYRNSLPNLETYVGPASNFIIDIAPFNKPIDKIVVNSGETLVAVPEAKEVYIGKTIKSISGFNGMRNTTKITVDDGNEVYASAGNCLLTKDKKTLLAGCINSVIPDGVERIGNHAFREVTSIESINIPASIKEIGEEAFYDCSNLKKVQFAENSALTTIEYQAFYRIGIDSISLPDSATTIGEGVFAGCLNLINVKLPTALEIIPTGIFYGAQKLQNVNFNELTNLKEISNSAFYDCYALSNIIIPQGVATIRVGAFEGTGARKIELPTSIKTIEFNAFRNMEKLEEFVIPKGTKLTTLPIACFEDCIKLNNVVLPKGINMIDERCFSGCQALDNIKLGTIKNIGKNAFKDCNLLKYVYLPISVCAIDETAFDGLTGVQFETPNQEIKNQNIALGIPKEAIKYDYDAKRSTPYFDYVVYENEAYIYNYNQNLKEVVIPSEIDGFKVVSFGLTFRHDYLDSLYIPDTVEFVSKDSFIINGINLIRCGAISQPEGWEEGWNGKNNIVWNVQPTIA